MVFKRIIATILVTVMGLVMMTPAVSANTEYELPDEDTYFKTYMSYKAITNTSSDQYKLQQICWTDCDGLRRQTDDFVVAMGTYYGEVGDRYKVTLTSGNEFTVIIGDIKADQHTDANNMYTAIYNEHGKFISANVLEFIVDTSLLPDKVKLLGTVSAIDFFKGNIEKLEKIENIK